RAFAAGLRPLLQARRLSALLLQFPFTFRDGADARERLRRLRDAFREFPLVVEVRHRSWAEADATAFLRAEEFSVANLDYPTSSDSFREPQAATGEPGYLRLHGRNAAEWFTRGAGRDARYDYLYDYDELDEIADRIGALSTRFRELVVVTNNHYRGQALANLAELAARAGGGERALPATLIGTYPRLAAVARPAGPQAAAGMRDAGLPGTTGSRRTTGAGRGGRGGQGSSRGSGEQRDLFDG
ncbi:MAG: DUF72 domain-containing protein, partial [Gemmatimonadetes bacterium]|nr:DUF72 domain-containing protein [Gemmatimonadota bacterium]